MRARKNSHHEPDTAARDSLLARIDAARAWRLDVPERAEVELQAAIRAEAKAAPGDLQAVYGQAGELALLAVDLKAPDALLQLAELWAESLRRRSARGGPPGETS
ncbi:MAG: hypothetical protein FIB00_10425 [Chloroflexi bacterium]|nr:hypothetical protein [Chloroflexota bacterium]PWB42693.1 MAG: hypothetical protein C3F10_13205 [Dehalococcoidia bacterium]